MSQKNGFALTDIAQKNVEEERDKEIAQDDEASEDDEPTISKSKNHKLLMLLEIFGFPYNF